MNGKKRPIGVKISQIYSKTATQSNHNFDCHEPPLYPLKIPDNGMPLEINEEEEEEEEEEEMNEAKAQTLLSKKSFLKTKQFNPFNESTMLSFHQFSSDITPDFEDVLSNFFNNHSELKFTSEQESSSEVKSETKFDQNQQTEETKNDNGAEEEEKSEKNQQETKDKDQKTNNKNIWNQFSRQPFYQYRTRPFYHIYDHILDEGNQFPQPPLRNFYRFFPHVANNNIDFLSVLILIKNYLDAISFHI